MVKLNPDIPPESGKGSDEDRLSQSPQALRHGLSEGQRRAVPGGEGHGSLGSVALRGGSGGGFPRPLRKPPAAVPV